MSPEWAAAWLSQTLCLHATEMGPKVTTACQKPPSLTAPPFSSLVRIRRCWASVISWNAAFLIPSLLGNVQAVLLWGHSLSPVHFSLGGVGEGYGSGILPEVLIHGIIWDQRTCLLFAAETCMISTRFPSPSKNIIFKSTLDCVLNWNKNTYVRIHLNSRTTDIRLITKEYATVMIQGKAVWRGGGLRREAGKFQSLWNCTIK